MPVEDWARAFSGPLFRNRLDPDHLSHVDEYGAAVGKTGPFFRGPQ